MFVRPVLTPLFSIPGNSFFLFSELTPCVFGLASIFLPLDSNYSILLFSVTIFVMTTLLPSSSSSVSSSLGSS